MDDNEKLEVNLKYVTRQQVNATKKVLIDNGIEADEADIVLQAIGYTLMNCELSELLDVE